MIRDARLDWTIISRFTKLIIDKGKKSLFQRNQNKKDVHYTYIKKQEIGSVLANGGYLAELQCFGDILADISGASSMQPCL